MATEAAGFAAVRKRYGAAILEDLLATPERVYMAAVRDNRAAGLPDADVLALAREAERRASVWLDELSTNPRIALDAVRRRERRHRARVAAARRRDREEAAS